MAFLTTVSVTKGTPATFSLDLAALLADAAVTDTYFQDVANIARIIITYESTEGGERVQLVYGVPSGYTTGLLTADFIVSLTARTDFAVQEILLVDNDGGKFLISRPKLLSEGLTGAMDVSAETPHPSTVTVTLDSHQTGLTQAFWNLGGPQYETYQGFSQTVETVAYGAACSVRAQGSGGNFNGWSGTLNGAAFPSDHVMDNPFSWTATGDSEFIPTYVVPSYSLTVVAPVGVAITVPGYGTTSGGTTNVYTGIAPNSDIGGISYSLDDGYTFDNWSTDYGYNGGGFSGNLPTSDQVFVLIVRNATLTIAVSQ